MHALLKRRGHNTVPCQNGWSSSKMCSTSQPAYTMVFVHVFQPQPGDGLKLICCKQEAVAGHRHRTAIRNNTPVAKTLASTDGAQIKRVRNTLHSTMPTTPAHHSLQYRNLRTIHSIATPCIHRPVPVEYARVLCPPHGPQPRGSVTWNLMPAAHEVPVLRRCRTFCRACASSPLLSAL